MSGLGTNQEKFIRAFFVSTDWPPYFGMWPARKVDQNTIPVARENANHVFTRAVDDR